MDQQMVSFRRIPEDDRAAGHMQRESGRDRQRNRDTDRQRERERRGERKTRNEEPFLFFSSCGSSSCSVTTKGQQLLQPSPGCCAGRERERRRDSPRITLICEMVHTSPSVCQMGYEMSGDRHVKGALRNC